MRVYLAALYSCDRLLRDPTAPGHSSEHWARHLQLACSPSAETPSVLTWCSGLRPGQIAGNLEALGLAAPAPRAPMRPARTTPP